MSIDQSVLNSAWEKLAPQVEKYSPEAAVILGSGWGKVAAAFDINDEIDYKEIPGLGETGVEGHSGKLGFGSLNDVQTVIFQGRRHLYEGSGWTPVAIPVFLMKKLGVKKVLITNAAGGINPELNPGDLMIIRDHINLQGDNPLVGPHNKFWGERFPDMTNTWNPGLRNIIKDAARQAGHELIEGVYAATRGPVYETPAEVEMIKKLGGDVVGMSTIPEAILAHSAGIKVAGLSCVTNYAAGISPTPLSHDEVTETAAKALDKITAITRAIWARL
ncbi:MAG: purine-nucleoside phosphorylase [Candidatus Dadabacteria bacterium]|nr:MAG: purine-nucleoside phosphorylase [Candidatus Dadabacteria bacterium]